MFSVAIAVSLTADAARESSPSFKDSPNLRSKIGAQLNEAEDFLVHLLHSNGFTRHRHDGRCGPQNGNAGCDPSSMKTCCTPEGMCVGKICFGSGCYNERDILQCEGGGSHDHEDHAKCRQRPQFYDPAEDVPCAHADARGAVASMRGDEAAAYFSAPIQDGEPRSVELRSLLASYKKRKIHDAVKMGWYAPECPSASGGSCVDARMREKVVGKLGYLEQQNLEEIGKVAHLKKSMGIETSDANFVQFAATKPQHLGALHAAMAAEDAVVNEQLLRLFPRLPALEDYADFDVGLDALLDPRPLPRPTEREMHCKLTPLAPLPPSRWCCAAVGSRAATMESTKHITISQSWRGLKSKSRTMEDEEDVCTEICRRGRGTGWNGFSWVHIRSGQPDACRCSFAPFDTVGGTAAWIREQECEELTGTTTSCIECSLGTCKPNVVEVFLPRDCPVEERYDELRILRDEVLKEEVFIATSPRFADPRKFDLTKCCTFDIWVEPKSKHGIELHWGGDNQNWGVAEFGKKSPFAIGTSKESACLKVTERSDIWLDGADEKKFGGWGAHTEHWLRSIPGWDDGRNWVTADGNDWGAGGGVHDIKKGFQNDAGKIVGDSIVAYDRRDWAIVIKSGMTSGKWIGDQNDHGCTPCVKCYEDGKESQEECTKENTDLEHPSIAFGYRHYFDVATPLTSSKPVVDWQRVALNTNRKYLAFFKGSKKRVRVLLANLHDEKLGFIALTSGVTPKETYDRYDYQSTMENAKFGLAPAGVGVHSYRMAECMQAGTVVVHVQGRTGIFVLPFSDTLDWSKFSFMFGSLEENFNRMPQILAAVPHAKWEAMQRRSVLVFKYFFNGDREITATFEILKRRIANAIALSPGTCG